MIEKLLGMLLGKAGSGAQGNLLGALLPMLLGGGDGGLDIGSILGKLQSGGMSGKVDTWVGGGNNERLTSRDVKRTIDPAMLEALAKKAGVSKRQAADGLGKLLPNVVDKLSPSGQMLEGQDLEDGIGGLKSALGF